MTEYIASSRCVGSRPSSSTTAASSSSVMPSRRCNGCSSSASAIADDRSDVTRPSSPRPSGAIPTTPGRRDPARSTSRNSSMRSASPPHVAALRQNIAAARAAGTGCSTTRSNARLQCGGSASSTGPAHKVAPRGNDRGHGFLVTARTRGPRCGSAPAPRTPPAHPRAGRDPPRQRERRVGQMAEQQACVHEVRGQRERSGDVRDREECIRYALRARRRSSPGTRRSRW